MSGRLLVFDTKDPSEAVRTYKVRKPHTKSRAGCSTCKQRRVKVRLNGNDQTPANEEDGEWAQCDEQRPTCGPCSRRATICSYLSRHAPEETDTFDVAASSGNLKELSRVAYANRAMNDASHGLVPTLWPGKRTAPILDNKSAFSSNWDLTILHHLAVGGIGPAVFVTSQPTIDVLSIAHTNPHCMHALLATSALHIRFRTAPNPSAPPPSTLLAALTSPSSSHPTSSIAYIEAGHHLSATTLFRSALSSLSPTTDIDPLLTTCMLLNLLSFAGLPEPEDHTRRWPFEGYGGERPLGWLRIQLGFAPLITGLSVGVREGSAWMRFFQGLGHEVLYDERDGVEGVPEGWCAFWGVNRGSEVEEHAYLRVVRRLVSIWELWKQTESEGGGGARHDAQCVKYLQFMQGVDEKFIRRLERRDVRALIAYGWFMAILAYVNHWWCRSRAWRECTAVVRYLDETYGPELENWLGFMADAVQYKLRGRIMLEI